jgi:hypothetical protein
MKRLLTCALLILSSHITGTGSQQIPQDAIGQQSIPQARQAISVTVDPYRPTVQVITYKPEVGYSTGEENAPTRNYDATVSDNPAISTTTVSAAPLRIYESSTPLPSDLGIPPEGYITTEQSNPLTSQPTQQAIYGAVPARIYTESTSNLQLASPPSSQNYIITSTNQRSLSYAPVHDDSVSLGAQVAGVAPERNYLSSTTSALKDYAPPPAAEAPILRSGISAPVKQPFNP